MRLNLIIKPNNNFAHNLNRVCNTRTHAKVAGLLGGVCKAGIETIDGVDGSSWSRKAIKPGYLEFSLALIRLFRMYQSWKTKSVE